MHNFALTIGQAFVLFAKQSPYTRYLLGISMSSRLDALNRWVNETAALTKPDHIHWCDGSAAEDQQLKALMVQTGDLIALNPATHPNCYLHRSHPSDVARVEHLTFVCSEQAEDAGPNNHWMAPADAHGKMDALYAGCMKGRTMYVIPYCMGPIDSPYARTGVEITDSPYVVINMRMMTRMGEDALARIERDGQFVRGLHSIGDLNPERRFIMHFPEALMIKSFGSGYGGNALLGKKCHSLRIASWQAKQEGWLAEHMLIVGIQNPAGETHYVAAAFPSACGKTNLAMLIPPASMPGWKVWTVGDDICWMQPGNDGRLYAINPEAGFFGVAPGTGKKTNANALAMLNRDAIFTNVALTDDLQPWWEGLDERAPALDWKGQPFDPKNGPAAHPNSRFTVSMEACPSYTDAAQQAAGVPISAIVFGGRRESLVPLVFEARDWNHGVLAGASMASETTAAATGAVGVVRRDPMAMKPFAGLNFGDYWQHWLSVGAQLTNAPKIFHVNWFRKGTDGKFLWPGFGDNLRVLAWILGRCTGKMLAQETPIGLLPRANDLDLSGMSISASAMDALLSVDEVGYRAECHAISAFLDEFGNRTPDALRVELELNLAKLSMAIAA
jgi:phosphoenolpyruvate carboxykinase (GTP)